jgi:hypothetical protein
MTNEQNEITVDPWNDPDNQYIEMCKECQRLTGGGCSGDPVGCVNDALDELCTKTEAQEYIITEEQLLFFKPDFLSEKTHYQKVFQEVRSRQYKSSDKVLENRIKELEDLNRLKDIDIKSLEERNERLEELIACDASIAKSSEKVLDELPNMSSGDLLLLAHDEWKRRQERKHFDDEQSWVSGWIGGFMTSKKWAHDYIRKLRTKEREQG